MGIAISDLDTEDSAEADACRVFFEQAKKQTLRDFDWPCATAFADLGLIGTAPTTEWGYNYQYPADCLKFRRILSGARNDSRQSAIPYRVVYGTSAAEIYTDLAEAVGEYTVDVTDTDRLTPDCANAISLRLAAYIAPRLTAGDPFKMGARALQLYQAEVSMAASNAFNEEQPEELVESEFIRGRE